MRPELCQADDQIDGKPEQTDGPKREADASRPVVPLPSSRTEIASNAAYAKAPNVYTSNPMIRTAFITAAAYEVRPIGGSEIP